MKRGLLIIGVAFAVTLAIFFGARVSPDALGIVVGVILGIMASVPATLLVVFVLARPRQDAGQYPPSALPQQPPVVVVTGQPPQPSYPPALPALPLPSVAPRRNFNIVGDEGTEN